MVDPDGVFEHEPLLPSPAAGRMFDSSRSVRLADASAGGRLRLDACARYLQDVANDDSRDAGSPNPTAWVARRTVMRVDRFPRYLDMIAISTWCSGIGSRWAERRYSMTPCDGSAGGVQAATLWVHIDMATMKPILVPTGFAAQFGAAADGRAISARLRLPRRPPTDLEPTTRPWPLRFVDFDVLGHVNNSVYWAIVEEQLATAPRLRAPLTLTLEHHDAIDRGDDVRFDVIDTDRGFDLWVSTVEGRVAATVKVTRDLLPAAGESGVSATT